MIGTGCQIQILLIKNTLYPDRYLLHACAEKMLEWRKLDKNPQPNRFYKFSSQKVPSFHFFLFWTDSIKLLLALQLYLPQSPHSLLKPLTALFFSSNSHHAKEQSQTLQTGVNYQNYSRATTNSPAPDWKPGMTVEALALQTRVYELQV